jgi:hypothetical protein
MQISDDSKLLAERVSIFRPYTNEICVSLIIKTNKCTNMCCIILKHTLKHLKSDVNVQIISKTLR